jgi:hypothetical protein
MKREREPLIGEVLGCHMLMMNEFRGGRKFA